MAQVKDDLLSLCHLAGESLNSWEISDVEEKVDRLADAFKEMGESVTSMKAKYVDAQINFAVSEMHKEDLKDKMDAMKS